MFAVIEVGGKQYRVGKDQTILVELAEGAAFEPRILMVVDGDNVVTDSAKLEKASVTGTVTKTTRERLSRTMKFKPKQGRASKKIMGHRRTRTHVKIDAVKL